MEEWRERRREEWRNGGREGEREREREGGMEGEQRLILTLNIITLKTAMKIH